MSQGIISLRGVEVHNLKGIDLDLPRQQLIVICGISGSGKTSLALDTLYAEGQRRYIESFSAYTRQFLERLDKPAAERIDGLPPAIAVTRGAISRSNRATVGTATEIVEYLRLLFAKIGRTICPDCGREVRRESAEEAAVELSTLPAGTRFLIAFRLPNDESLDLSKRLQPWREAGFVRAIVAGRTVNLSDVSPSPQMDMLTNGEPDCFLVVDRLTAGEVSLERLRDSLEGAFRHGGGTAYVFVEGTHAPQRVAASPMQSHAKEHEHSKSETTLRGREYSLDDWPFRQIGFSDALRCDDCQLDFLLPEPRLFSFNSPLGACPLCEGTGQIVALDERLIIPDRKKTLRNGAIAPWTSNAYAGHFRKLLAMSEEIALPLDVPCGELSAEQWQQIREGVSVSSSGIPDHDFVGLDRFFADLEQQRQKTAVRAFLNRWKSASVCPACSGRRLRSEALFAQVGNRNMAQWCEQKIGDALAFIDQLKLTEHEQRVSRIPLDSIRSRLQYLESVGLKYLTLDRTMKTLSAGEAQRVELTSALGSTLVGMLYVLDEPSTGLHPRDVEKLLSCILKLRERKNTVVAVEHEELVIRAADQIIEIGPGAGERGGEVVFQGTPSEIVNCEKSLTGDYLTGRRGMSGLYKRRPVKQGRIRLTNARGNNLRALSVEFPLGLLCVVTGVSGAGKSTLVQETLFPALCRRMNIDGATPLPYDDVFGDGQLEQVALVDQSPIGRSPRSNPVTYIKAFDEIRGVFAETAEARMRNLTAGHFSFNVEGGRCNACEGDGYLEIDMQFLADVFMKCAQCQGRRYRREILQVKYRNKSIADVLDMTAREAFSFFRGCKKAQIRLKQLMDVGLDYLRLGQPANTLSGGESQRLKLAGFLAAKRRGRSLFILDEPTTGLHFADVVKLLDCFESLLSVGHSLIVVEHNVQMMKAADWIIDLGPGAAEEGGQIVAQGTPEQVADDPHSVTGHVLAEAFERERRLLAEIEEEP